MKYFGLLKPLKTHLYFHKIDGRFGYVQFVSLFRLKDLLFTAQQIGMKLNNQHSTFELSLLITAESNSWDMFKKFYYLFSIFYMEYPLLFLNC